MIETNKQTNKQTNNPNNAKQQRHRLSPYIQFPDIVWEHLDLSHQVLSPWAMGNKVEDYTLIFHF